MKYIETESRRVGARGWGRGMESECFMGTESQFGKMRKFWRRMVGMVAGQCERT